jgi:hypothetical protein
MINYKWIINEVITSDLEDQKDVIVEVNYTVEGEDIELGITKNVNGYEKFMYFAHEQEVFIPFLLLNTKQLLSGLKKRLLFLELKQ